MHSNQFKEDSAHFYLMDENDNIIDPTESQYKPGKLTKTQNVSAIKNIDYIINHNLFKTLSKSDQNQIKQLL